MAHYIKKILIGIGVFGAFVFMAPVALVGAQAQQGVAAPGSSIADNVCRGVLSAEGGTIPQDTTIASCREQGDDSFGFIVRRIINIFSVVVGAVAVIMIIIGGFRYIISGGDSSGVSGAKNTILYAIVGLVIVLFAQIIVRFVLTNVAPS
jgi:hypothetical protein